MKPARYIMIGGFLGAGKTTSVGQLAQFLTDRGLKVGLITNDQGSELVDTAMLRSRGFAVEQIAGGCFCCRFNSLTEAAQKLTEANRPDVFIAEPVGSCTDLVATVSYPLRRIYGENYSVAPLSVLVDPVRAARVFGLEEGGAFSEKIVYIYRKQLAEANLIVINKIDSLAPEKLARLQTRLEQEFPKARVIAVSARTGAGLAEWFAAIENADASLGSILEIDYEIYAEGEALLGWLNCTVNIRHAEAFEADALLRELAAAVQKELARNNAEIAHLKMTLSPDGGLNDIAIINLVRNDFVPELSQSIEEPVELAQLILNLRAEGAPEMLREAVEKGIGQVRAAQPGLEMTLDHLEFFRPGKPQPTHRMTKETA